MISEAKIDRLIGIGNDLFDQQSIFKLSGDFHRTSEDFIASLNENSFSNSAILLKGARSFNFENIASSLQQKAHQTVLEINLDSMIENLNTFRSKLKNTTKIMAMVKAFSTEAGLQKLPIYYNFIKLITWQLQLLMKA